ncbi:hypothetical protein MSS2_01132 [Mycobacterium marinum]|nr:hypothetical protein MSS2_01132 [Mycobacterium marinum]
MNLDPTAAHLLAGLTQFHTALQNRFHQMNALPIPPIGRHANRAR